MENLNRGYMLFQTDFSMHFERTFETDDPKMPRIKHVIQPTLTYSRIPYTNQPDHPFMRQIRYHSGYNFDDLDIVPLEIPPSTVNYFVPLGHSISYGVTNQVLSRQGSIDSDSPVYNRNVELDVGQTFDILELKQPEDSRVPLTRAYVNLNVVANNFGLGLNYFYYP